MVLKNPDETRSEARTRRQRVARQLVNEIRTFADDPSRRAGAVDSMREMFDSLLAEAPEPAPEKEAEPEPRQRKGGRNRMEKGGEDRSDEDSQEELPTE